MASILISFSKDGMHGWWMLVQELDHHPRFKESFYPWLVNNGYKNTDAIGKLYRKFNDDTEAVVKFIEDGLLNSNHYIE